MLFNKVHLITTFTTCCRIKRHQTKSIDIVPTIVYKNKASNNDYGVVLQRYEQHDGENGESKRIGDPEETEGIGESEGVIENERAVDTGAENEGEDNAHEENGEEENGEEKEDEGEKETHI